MKADTGDPGFIQVCFDIRNMEALGNIARSSDTLYRGYNPAIQGR